MDGRPYDAVAFPPCHAVHKTKRSCLCPFVLLNMLAAMFLLNALHLQDPKFDARFVPNYDLYFESLNDAFVFYKSCGQVAGLPVKKNKKRYGERG